MTSPHTLSGLSNDALLAETARLAGRERTATAELVAALAEVDARRLYLGEGCSSMFAYCTRVLRLSEHAAYGRIEAARVARRFPVVMEMLAAGSLTLTSLGLLGRSLTPDNHIAVLKAACHRSTREVEQQAAALRPLLAVASSVRKLPQQQVSMLEASTLPAPVGTEPRHPAVITTPSAHVGSRRPVVKPLAPEQYRVQFTIA